MKMEITSKKRFTPAKRPVISRKWKNFFFYFNLKRSFKPKYFKFRHLFYIEQIWHEQKSQRTHIWQNFEGI